MRITAKAPCRINDIGGWTDTWFAKHGNVCSVAVWPGVEVQIETNDGQERTIHFENYGTTYDMVTVPGIFRDHPAIWQALISHAPTNIGWNINIYSAMPPGASTGTSAAVLVALVGALYELSGNKRGTLSHISAEAHKAETDIGLESGIQDQAAAVCGGISLYNITYPHWRMTGSIYHADVVARELESRLRLVYLGQPHHSSKIHKQVIAGMGEDPEFNKHIEALRLLACSSMKALQDRDFKTYGQCMTRNTEIQDEMNFDLVSWEARQMKQAMAFIWKDLGFKVNGAGGDGGSITILTDGNREKMREASKALTQFEAVDIPIRIAHEGLQVWRWA